MHGGSSRKSGERAAADHLRSEEADGGIEMWIICIQGWKWKRGDGKE